LGRWLCSGWESPSTSLREDRCAEVQATTEEVQVLLPHDVRDLGRQEYEATWKLMKELRADRKSGKIPDTLLLVEHPHVITVGVQGADGEAVPPDIPVFNVERGGKVTYHGPGQQVGYLIVDIDRRGRDVRKFVHDVEELVARALAPMGISASRIPGKRGVWVEGRKIASVGIAVEGWVTYHGFALNVNTDLSYFERFHPCGFEGRVMTSVQKVLGRKVEMDEVKPHIIEAWGEVFQQETQNGAYPATLKM
jgi:lipoate-protein ligase B